MAQVPNVRRTGGRTTRGPIAVNISGILNNAMRAVSDAQTAVAQIQNIAHIDTVPPYVPPDTPTIDPLTGLPRQSQGRATGGNVPVQGPAPQVRVHSDNSAIHMAEGTLINIVNSQNVQIGHHNRMYITGKHVPVSESSSDSDPDMEDEDTHCRKSQLADAETAEILRESQRQVSDAELQTLSRHIGGAWRRLIRLLGIEDSEVDYVFHTHQSDGLEEVIYQLLKKWKQEQEDPTVGKLIQALERADMTRLLRHLRP